MITYNDAENYAKELLVTDLKLVDWLYETINTCIKNNQSSVALSDNQDKQLLLFE